MCDYLLRTEFTTLFSRSRRGAAPATSDVATRGANGESAARSTVEAPIPAVTSRMDMVNTLQHVIADCFGYKFRQPHMLVTAFTHPVRFTQTCA